MLPTDSSSGNASRFEGLVEGARRDLTAPFAPPVLTTHRFKPDAFPDCEIIREISRGGQGVVLEAAQKGTQRRVAIKVMREGLIADDKERLRFEQEIAVLGQLKHPNIVAIHNSGVVEGHFYFTMDHIDGQRMDAYVRGGFQPTGDAPDRAPVETTLRLFQKICDAVNAAHLAGVIHRDLKPGNILVDEKGEPHILDFGLAKVMAARPEDSSSAAATLTTHFVGTPEWASPEQVDQQPHLLDTRTDVYSLGVMLYHMLTGRMPYPATGSLRQIFDHIAQTEPARPRTLCRDIDHELETILLKCLSKDRSRRYATAGDLGRDITRYLSGDPIEAKSGSNWYVARKALRRYRIPLAIAAAFVVLVSASAVALGVLYRNERFQYERAEKALLEEEAQHKLADQRADETKKVAEFQAKMLKDIDVQAMGRGIQTSFRDQVRASLERQYVGEWPDRRKRTQEEIEAELADYDRLAGAVQAPDIARRVIDDDVLALAAKELETGFTDQPLVRAALQQTVADVYREIALYDRAMPLQEEALATRRRELGNDHPDTLTSIHNLAGVLGDQGKWAEAEPLLHEALDGSRRILGDDHRDTLNSLGNLGYLLEATNRPDQAAPYYEEVLERRRRLFGNEHPDTLLSLQNMGYLCARQGRFVEAEKFLGEALETRRRVSGEEHPATLSAIANIAGLYMQQRRFSEAELLFRQVLEVRARVLGNDHPDTLLTLNNLGGALKEQGNLAEAERYFSHALEGLRRTRGEAHAMTLRTMTNLGNLLVMLRKYEEAEPHLRLALAHRLRTLGDDHPDTLTSINNMVTLFLAQDKYTEAEPFAREEMEIRRRTQGSEHRETLKAIAAAGALLRELGKLEEADQLGAEAVATAQRVLPGKPDTGKFLSLHGQTLAAMKHFKQAEERILEAQTILHETLGPTHLHTRAAIKSIADLYTAWHAAEPDKGYDAKAAEWSAKLDELEASTHPSSQPESQPPAP